MKSTHAVYELYWKCPHCGFKHGLKSSYTALQSIMQGDADGHMEKQCTGCGKDVAVKPAGAKKETKPLKTQRARGE